MEAIGRLAGGIAHDFNNLLTVISGYSEIALARDDPVEIHRAIKEVVSAAGSATALTGQLLAFSRQQVLQPQVIDVSVVIGSVEGLLGRLLGKDVALTVTVQPDLRPITVDPSQIEQVLLNLAVNASDAMPGGGKLGIAVDNVDLAEADVVSSVGLEPGSYVSVAVSDTGEGMDEETIGRIFEPFFTTKSGAPGSASPPCTASSFRAVDTSRSRARRAQAPPSGFSSRQPRARPTSSRLPRQRRRAAAPDRRSWSSRTRIPSAT
jgi:signal transduction histidine kinase